MKKEMVITIPFTLIFHIHTVQAAGTAETSFLSTLLEEKRHEDHLIKWAAASIEVGGSDTVS